MNLTQIYDIEILKTCQHLYEIIIHGRLHIITITCNLFEKSLQNRPAKLCQLNILTIF